jgi:hypothetical protein
MSYSDTWAQALGASTSSGQNSAGLSLYNASEDMMGVGRSVEQLELHELMKNRAFQELHQRWTIATSTMVETTQANNALLKENTELKFEIQRLKVNEGCVPYGQFIIFSLF